MNTTTPYLIALAAGLVLGQAILTVWLVRALRGVRAYEERLSQLGTAMSLLTETTESGFGVMASEIERLGQAASRRTTATGITTARVARAARRGRTVQEIAAAEEISEGEVHLRLHLADAAGGRLPSIPPDKVHDAGAPRAARGKPDGALRS